MRRSLCLMLIFLSIPILGLASISDSLLIPESITLPDATHVMASYPLTDRLPDFSPKSALSEFPTGLSSVSSEDSTSLPFAIHHGDRNQKRIALTMDDCYTAAYVQETFDLCQKFGVPITFYPLGCVLNEEDRNLWLTIAASDCEIGTHTQTHGNMGHGGTYRILSNLLRPQQVLDRLLGYHYPIQTVRPPYGSYADEHGNVRNTTRLIQRSGFQHVILWDVSQTNPQKALQAVRNGSILLFHARPADIRCLSCIIPQLQEQGYEMVTVTELFGMKKLATSTDLYVFNIEDYQ